MIRRPALWLVILALSSLALTGANTTFATFKSDRGFSASYPISWIPDSDSTEELSILSGGRRVKGAVIPRGEAEIIVRKLAFVRPDKFRSFLERAYDAKFRSRRAVILRRARGRPCHHAELVNADFELAPGAIQHQSFLLCNGAGSSVIVVLTQWARDRSNPAWKKTMFQIAASVTEP